MSSRFRSWAVATVAAVMALVVGTPAFAVVDLSAVTGSIVAADLTTPILAVAGVIAAGLATMLAWRYAKRIFGG